MKRTILACLLAISLGASAQKKDSTLTDSTAILSIKDLQPVYQELQKLPYQTAKPFIDYLQSLVMVRSKEYTEKTKKKSK
jgi:hypothetical protein